MWGVDGGKEVILIIVLKYKYFLHVFLFNIQPTIEIVTG